MRTYIDITEEDLKEIFTLALEHAKRRLRGKLTVRDVMTEKVIAVREEASLKEVVSILSEKGISGLPVVDAQNRVIGIVTEADILSQMAPGRKLSFKEIVRHLIGEPVPKRLEEKISEIKVKDIMTSPVITIGPDADIRDVAIIFEQKRIKRLPVVDKDNRLIGIISRQDIVRAFASENK
ncbi:MAG: hypothetical protein C0197_02995 [Caldimicrobium thiodismutans]|uniref:CBS domain-containing protein n=1 Tax=Caldimicrobium thiodismutans TaxID=1653476 RepID=A0A2N7PJX7_9BACT|nr:MAG: hypothetical protein C0197_02995 [Caldimicrobium thiodismutans]